MVHAKNYETVSTFAEVMKKNCGLFFPDTVYSVLYTVQYRVSHLPLRSAEHLGL